MEETFFWISIIVYILKTYLTNTIECGSALGAALSYISIIVSFGLRTVLYN